MHCFGKYSGKYTKLTDVFENLTKTCQKNVGLNQKNVECWCYYIRVTGLSWDVMLKTAGVEVKVSVIFASMFVEKGMKGEIYVAHKYGWVNNMYMDDKVNIQWDA